MALAETLAVAIGRLCAAGCLDQGPWLPYAGDMLSLVGLQYGTNSTPAVSLYIEQAFLDVSPGAGQGFKGLRF